MSTETDTVMDPPKLDSETAVTAKAFAVADTEKTDEETDEETDDIRNTGALIANRIVIQPKNAKEKTSSERKTVTLEREEISSGHATTMDSLVTSRLIAFTTNKFKSSILKLRKPASDRELL
ncbi:hypothetical protein BDD12DRAFT_914254 [Trichophaea hybrida]|nr:hypothetical protein BDD12DRAFT_914254 [Trichophaea hybrida]